MSIFNMRKKTSPSGDNALVNVGEAKPMPKPTMIPIKICEPKPKW